ncbi:MAG: hypothetical protein ACPHUL_00150 [Marinomonas gallaica]
MSKIIIHNESSQADHVAVNLVHNVMAKGKISGESQYCWHTHWAALKISVIAMPTRGKTHTFKIKDEVMDK